MINHIFKGLGVALITPFNEDDSIDYTALGNIIDYQVNNGIDYMVVLGTTGETPTLSEEEKKVLANLEKIDSELQELGTEQKTIVMHIATKPGS